MPFVAFDLSKDVIDRDYRGCGKAWAAIKDGAVVGLRYMGEHRCDTTALPAWAKAVWDNPEGLDERMMPVCMSSRGFAKMAAAAQSCADCPKPPRRKRYRPAELLSMARAIIAAIDAESFGRYRAQCRAELANLGTVVSGMASCHQFCCNL